MEARNRHYSELMARVKLYREQNTMKELQKMKNQLSSKAQKHAI